MRRRKFIITALGLCLWVYAILASPVPASAQNAPVQYSYGVLELPNQWTAVNFFQLGLTTGPLTFAVITGSSFPVPGTIVLCSNCTAGSSPLAVGSSQVYAVYLNGIWTSLGSGGGGNTYTGIPPIVVNNSTSQISCPTCGVGTGNVTTTPGSGVNQNINQQLTTEFSANIFNQVRYASYQAQSVNPASYQWLNVSTATCAGSGAVCTATLPAGILGIYGSDATSGVLVTNGVGTTEYDQLLGGGTYTPSAGGTIRFATANVFTNPTLGSASSGIQEAVNDAMSAASSGTAHPNWAVECAPTNPPSAAYYSIFYPVTIPQTNGELRCPAASVNVQVSLAVGAPAATSVANSNCGAAFCFLSSAGGIDLDGFRVSTSLPITSAAITATACSSNVATITSALHPPVGSVVTQQWTDNPFYWGKYQIATSSSTSYTYTYDSTGTAISCTSIASATTPGGAAISNAFVDDNTGSGYLHVHDIQYETTAFNLNDYELTDLITIESDESYYYDHISAFGGHQSPNYCTAAFCPNVINSPTNKDPIGQIDDINLSVSCGANGILNVSGQGMTINGAIIQGYAQYGIFSGPIRGSSGQTILRNVYEEPGCEGNPAYVQAGFSSTSQASESSAGVNQENSTLQLNDQSATHEPGVQGFQPVFCTGGSTTYTLWLVVLDGANESIPMPFGTATPTTSSTSCMVGWPRYASQTGSTVTYQVLVSVGTGAGVSAPYGSGNWAVASSAFSQCSIYICTANVSNWASLDSFTVASVPTLSPLLWNFPGGVVLGGAAALSAPSGIGAYGGVVAASNSAAGINALVGDIPTPGLNAASIANSVQNSNNVYGATVFSLGPTNSNHISGNGIAKGRLNLQPDLSLSEICAQHWFTLLDSNPFKTIADPVHRPLADAADTWIGDDNSTCPHSPGSAQLAFGNPNAISMYIDNLGDNASWVLRITSGLATFQYPVNFNQGGNSLLPINGAGPFSLTNPITTDNFQRANSASLGSNWTAVLGSFGINSDSAVVHSVGNTGSGYCESSSTTCAIEYYSASSFSADQCAQAQVNYSPSYNFDIGLGVRGSTSQLAGYLWFGSPSGWFLYTFSGGAFVNSLATSGTAVATGSAVQVCAVGSKITLVATAPGSQPVTLFSGTDTNVASGVPTLFGTGVSSLGWLTNFAAYSASWITDQSLAAAAVTVTSLTDSGLTAGNCVQAGTGGLLSTTGTPCGSGGGGGTVTVTGTPAAGNLTAFSGGTSITNVNISGDCTTSGTAAITCLKTNGVSFGPLATATSPLTRANGGLNSSTPGTGLLRDGTTPAASELSGDCATSGSNATTCLKTNGVLFGTFATQNYATPPVIGGTTPNAATFTNLTVTASLITPSITINGATPITSTSSANSQVVTCITGGSGTQVCDAAGAWIATAGGSGTVGSFAGWTGTSGSTSTLGNAPCTYSGSNTACSGSVASSSDGVHAGAVQVIGNTTVPTTLNTSNYWGIIGPDSASFSSYFWQPPSAPPSSGQTIVFAACSGTPQVCSFTYGNANSPAVPETAGITVTAAQVSSNTTFYYNGGAFPTGIAAFKLPVTGFTGGTITVINYGGIGCSSACTGGPYYIGIVPVSGNLNGGSNFFQLFSSTPTAPSSATLTWDNVNSQWVGYVSGSASVNPDAVFNNQNNTYAANAVQTFPVSGTVSDLVLGTTVTDPCCTLSAGSVWMNTTPLNGIGHIRYFDGSFYATVLTAADSPANMSNGITGSGATVLATSPSLVTPNIGDATGTSLTLATTTGDQFDLQAGVGFIVAGSLTSGTFASGEAVVQTTTSASSTYTAIEASGNMLITAVTGTPNSSSTWVGQTSGAVFTPTATPATPYIQGVPATGHIKCGYGSDSKWQCSYNDNPYMDMPQTVAASTATMTTSAISAGACGSTVTVAATNVQTTDVIEWSYSGSVGANPGVLIVNAWATAGDVNFAYCNPTAGSVTPTAKTLLWAVRR